MVVPADPADRVVCNMKETMIQLKGIRKNFYEGTANKAAKLNPIEALRCYGSMIDTSELVARSRSYTEIFLSGSLSSMIRITG